MTNRVDRLETRGLLERLPDPDDRRGVLVALTSAGVELADRAIGVPTLTPVPSPPAMSGHALGHDILRQRVVLFGGSAGPLTWEYDGINWTQRQPNTVPPNRIRASLVQRLGMPGLVLTFAGGMCRAVEHAARQSYTHDVVGAGSLINGFAILGVAMRAGWLLGSLGIGAIIARQGSGVAYLAVAAGYLAGGAVLIPASVPPATTGHDPGSLWYGVIGFVRALRRNRVLLALMTLTAGAEILGFSHQALLPSLARDVLRSGPEGLGVLNAARAVGGILGLVVVSMRSHAHGGGNVTQGRRRRPAAATEITSWRRESDDAISWRTGVMICGLTVSSTTSHSRTHSTL